MKFALKSGAPRVSGACKTGAEVWFQGHFFHLDFLHDHETGNLTPLEF